LAVGRGSSKFFLYKRGGRASPRGAHTKRGIVLTTGVIAVFEELGVRLRVQGPVKVRL